MGVAGEVGFEVAGGLGRAGAALHLGIEQAFENARVRRAQAADSVSSLGYRLRDARQAQRAAEARAAAAETRLAVVERALSRAVSDAAALREALSIEREFSAGLREILGA